MSFAKAIAFIAVLTLTGCEMADDLAPDGSDRRPAVEAGTIGPHVGQIAPDFTLQDTLYGMVALSTELVDADAVVLYFTMWCPVCDSHMSHMRSTVMPQYPNVTFWFADYVSGSVEVARAAQVSSGYSGVTVLVDPDQGVLDNYTATMGTTVVVDSNGVVRMNEDYKDGTRLQTVLGALP